eukprot:NODE_607_length_1498_cov_239.147688_g454_i0.p1 GENE.NODE_607_length_1498_cov_239.147688_g454_i0~~NODE_607_length_1498_cov_239.147688_g454_i0.p1  ORF type:complete len:392 (-),score=123.24 NODE_607_length_1498_cov_239.147688_g454_i0:322-1428(-)
MVHALILIGGFGTRLRPLTITQAKPLVPFANKAMLIHQLEALHKFGVKVVVLAVLEEPTALKQQLAPFAEQLGMTLVYSVETEPLGTAGPIALARDTLLQDDDPFFVLNSDVICDYPLAELLAFHQKHGKEGTLLVAKAEKPEQFGVVAINSKGEVEIFAEKPETSPSDQINAGIYVFNKSVLNRLQPKRTSLETEVFPQMVEERQLMAMSTGGFWMDIDNHEHYLQGSALYLATLAASPEGKASLFTGGAADQANVVVGNVLISASAKVGAGCKLGPDVIIGDNCEIGDGVRLRNCVLLNDVTIGQRAFVDKSILGHQSKIGEWCRVSNMAVLGEDVQVKAELLLNGAKVLPHKEIKESVSTPQVIM